jgi:hypothetical protein
LSGAYGALHERKGGTNSYAHRDECRHEGDFAPFTDIGRYAPASSKILKNGPVFLAHSGLRAKDRASPGIYILNFERPAKLEELEIGG